ncbi:unnamed protein product, partial [Brenthis ino]
MMVSNLQLQEKYNKIRKNFCFYLDIQDPGLSRSISRRLQDMGLYIVTYFCDKRRAGASRTAFVVKRYF